MWILIWVLLTPGGDIIERGVHVYESRGECNSFRVRVESQPMLFGQKIQAICIEKSK